MNLHIVSVNVGKPVTVEYKGKPLQTGIYKQQVEGNVFVGSEQMTGDGQADLVHHGGLDKAVCAYPYEHYSHWEKELDRKLDYSAFGENLTVMGLLETEVCIGDVYQVGEVVLQVSQPRYPCFKLSQKHGVTNLPARVIETGYSGFYLRVLQEGYLSVTSTLTKLESHPAQLTIAEVLRLIVHGRDDVEQVERLKKAAELDVLASSLRERFQGWLNT
ncbi:MOSC domain-containing protein [Paenibacillus sp. IHBB 10380]|uniref:MOSC domain-containing protein n=1 Tax=Paenibacillus sp. IHBB 10380 TaxID=1566358 RepID=UPI0005CFB008|nr:MOSC domain-containing protein [Paenibacillus sp. IHBB 10380]AJS60431.1 sulfurase [Paenibacillus sp. IHBB 10380]